MSVSKSHSLLPLWNNPLLMIGSKFALKQLLQSTLRAFTTTTTVGAMPSTKYDPYSCYAEPKQSLTTLPIILAPSWHQPKECNEEDLLLEVFHLAGVMSRRILD